jgi:hypothetical protein
MEQKKEEIKKNIYELNYKRYLHTGLSVIPDKYQSKAPCIKAWTDFCFKLPNTEEVASWNRNFKETGIALCTGKASGIIALDIDETRQEILDLIMPQLPESPVVKKGAKGETRFFKYMGEVTDTLKYNGEVVFEILSDKKKTTLPPSVHPNGYQYTWVTDKTLLDIDAADLPVLPPYLLSSIYDRLKLHIPQVVQENQGKIVNGRNDELVKLCGVLISQGEPVDTAIKKLVEHDYTNSDTPLFTDPEENAHTEPFSNALKLYTNVLQTVNSGHFRKQTEYEIPMTASVLNKEAADALLKGKSPLKVLEGKSKRELPSVTGALKTLMQNILENSYIKQPEFALASSLSVMSVLAGRKFEFQGVASNLYLLNVGPSGCGKDRPQKKAIEYLIDIGCERLIGATDYGSDAGIVDSLPTQPVRLDIIDEASKVLKSISGSKSEHSSKGGDILTELYTSSSSKYLGRALAEGRKGETHRPCLSILASTTPEGLSESVTKKSIAKGLLGRFMIFQSNNNPSNRVKTNTGLDNKTLNHLRWIAGYEPEIDMSRAVNNIGQKVYTVHAETKADDKLEEYFREFDDLRTSLDSNDSMLPIVARLYQQTLKLTLICAVSRSTNREPVVTLEDVNNAYNITMYYYGNMQDIVSKYIYDSQQEKSIVKVLTIISDAGVKGITKREFNIKARFLKAYERDNIIKDLYDGREIMVSLEHNGGEQQTVYRSVE